MSARSQGRNRRIHQIYFTGYQLTGLQVVKTNPARSNGPQGG